MKRVAVLKIPTLLCAALYIFVTIAAICTTIVFIHIQIDPQYYSSWDAGWLAQNGILSYKVFESWNTGMSKQETLLSFDRIKRISLYFNYLQILGVLSLILFTVKEFLNIIKSVELIETFHQNNIQSFAKMHKYLFVIFILSGITIVNAQEANLYSYSFHLTPFILSIAALIMSGIFKKGNQLLEENRLTI